MRSQWKNKETTWSSVEDGTIHTKYDAVDLHAFQGLHSHEAVQTLVMLRSKVADVEIELADADVEPVVGTDLSL